MVDRCSFKSTIIITRFGEAGFEILFTEFGLAVIEPLFKSYVVYVELGIITKPRRRVFADETLKSSRQRFVRLSERSVVVEAPTMKL